MLMEASACVNQPRYVPVMDFTVGVVYLVEDTTLSPRNSSACCALASRELSKRLYLKAFPLLAGLRILTKSKLPIPMQRGSWPSQEMTSGRGIGTGLNEVVVQKGVSRQREGSEILQQWPFPRMA